MVDAFTVEKEAPFNTWLILLFSIGILGLLWVSLTGFQGATLKFIITAVAFGPMISFIDYISPHDTFLRSKAGFRTMALGFTWPILLGELFFSSGNNFSFYSSAWNSIGPLSTVLPQDPWIRYMTVDIITPILETGFAVAGGIFMHQYVFKPFYTYIGMPYHRVVSATTVSTIFSFIFTKIHGPRALAFQALAFIVMFLMLFPVFMEDITKSTILPLLPLGISSIAGAHVALNVSNSGGMLTVMNGIMQAPGTIAWGNAVINIFLLVTFFAAATKIWDITLGRYPGLRFTNLIRRGFGWVFEIISIIVAALRGLIGV